MKRKIELDFGNARDPRWTITLLWYDEEGKDLCNTKIVGNYNLSDGKVKLPIPEKCLNYQGKSRMDLMACPTGYSYTDFFFSGFLAIMLLNLYVQYVP